MEKTENGRTTASQRVKTTVLLDRTLKKLAQVYAVQNDLTLGELIEQCLRSRVVE